MNPIKNSTLLIICMLLIGCKMTIIACGPHGPACTHTDYPIQPVTFTSVKLTDNFWAPRIRINQETTIPIALGHCYNTGRVDNFKKAGGLLPGYFGTDLTFDDTDIYKIIEGISYSIQMFPNPELDARMDTLIYYIEKAQEPDGYLFTPRTAGEPGNLHDWVGEKRWEKDPDLSHELYNCGHLYEAAVAHYEATGKRSLLDIAIRNADLLVKDFGPGKLQYEPGHQIVEMGLVKMFRVTGKQEYLDLAKFFLDVKGNGERGEYCQSHKPVTEQDEAVGHAVRAAYMYSGMADVAALTGDESYLNAIDKIWENVVSKKYYITGGIGATSHGEAFGKNYELPNMSAYCETCAAIANVYWNHRLFLLHGQSAYYDVVERTLYNGLISGISLAGDRFFYPNPLESVGQHGRSEWFGCACCPSNVCRFMPSIPGYVYAQRENTLYVNLFIESEGETVINNNRVLLSQKTDYPWKGEITLNIQPEKTEAFEVKIRIPGWARNQPVPSDLYTYLNPTGQNIVLKVNGKEVKSTPGTDGYVTINRTWQKGDKVDISLPMEIHRTISHPLVKDNEGKVSLERGPIVYCLEWVDNNEKVLNSVLEDQAIIREQYESGFLNGVISLIIDGKSAYQNKARQTIAEDTSLKAIPYYAWANRGSGEMAVWIPRTDKSTRPLPPPTISTQATVTASTTNRSLSSVQDGFWPENSNDRKVPFFSLWPKNNTTEWIAYELEQPETISEASVYWYDDRPWGGCRIPRSWHVEYKNRNGEWIKVNTHGTSEVVKDEINRITFEPVTAQQVRLVIELPEKESVGVYEFEIK